MCLLSQSVAASGDVGLRGDWRTDSHLGLALGPTTRTLELIESFARVWTGDDWDGETTVAFDDVWAMRKPRAAVFSFSGFETDQLPNLGLSQVRGSEPDLQQASRRASWGDSWRLESPNCIRLSLEALVMRGHLSSLRVLIFSVGNSSLVWPRSSWASSQATPREDTCSSSSASGSRHTALSMLQSAFDTHVT